ncbi:hypothetical protein Mgra_00000208 [Meloidogyne graminicola]|uniref:Uncharacterized protein n=1 Tax=Meloidogyne graminicola TaxID=189291 RepID=A0A8T0A3G7_9BILA|nr:hypothetical protein Mgra_00000208 [Meloidogyne graminicola]
MPTTRHKRRSSSPASLGKSRHHSSERHRNGSQRFENDSRRPSRRSPSPPMAFRRDSSAPYYRSSSFRSRGFISSRPRSFSIRGGRSSALSRFSTRSRFPRVPFHGRHSPMRSYDRRSSSPSGLHSLSSSQAWDRGRPFRGSTRATRRADFIGSFGRPIYYQPEYEVSPDRTTEDKLPTEPEELVEDRDELFSKMMEAKRSEKYLKIGIIERGIPLRPTFKKKEFSVNNERRLDDYYRLRDLLNAFDRRNPHLAFRGSGRVASRRKHTESPERNCSEKKARIDVEQETKTNNNRGAVLGEELEEVDCTETRFNFELDKNDNSVAPKVKNKETEMEQISNEDTQDNYQNEAVDYDDKSANRDDIYCGDLYEEENAVELDFMEDEIVDEELSEHPKFTQVREKHKQGEEVNIKHEQPFFHMFRPEFVPILISSLRKGAVIIRSKQESFQLFKQLREAYEESILSSSATEFDSNKINTQLLDESNVAKSHVEPEIVDSNITKKRGRKSKKTKGQEKSPIKSSLNQSETINTKEHIEELQSKEISNKQVPTLLEIALCYLITSEMNSNKKINEIKYIFFFSLINFVFCTIANWVIYEKQSVFHGHYCKQVFNDLEKIEGQENDKADAALEEALGEIRLAENNNERKMENSLFNSSMEKNNFNNTLTSVSLENDQSLPSIVLINSPKELLQRSSAISNLNKHSSQQKYQKFEFMPHFDRETYEFMVPEEPPINTDTLVAVLTFFGHLNAQPPQFELKGEKLGWFTVGEVASTQGPNYILAEVPILRKKKANISLSVTENGIYKFKVQSRQGHLKNSAQIKVEILPLRNYSHLEMEPINEEEKEENNSTTKQTLNTTTNKTTFYFSNNLIHLWLYSNLTSPQLIDIRPHFLVPGDTAQLFLLLNNTKTLKEYSNLFPYNFKIFGQKVEKNNNSFEEEEPLLIFNGKLILLNEEINLEKIIEIPKNGNWKIKN